MQLSKKYMFGQNYCKVLMWPLKTLRKRRAILQQWKIHDDDGGDDDDDDDVDGDVDDDVDDGQSWFYRQLTHTR